MQNCSSWVCTLLTVFLALGNDGKHMDNRKEIMRDTIDQLLSIGSFMSSNVPSKMAIFINSSSLVKTINNEKNENVAALGPLKNIHRQQSRNLGHLCVYVK